MPTETLDQNIRRRLETRRREWGELARLADVSYSWIAKFVDGQIRNPGIRTLEQLQRALAQKRPRKAPAPPAGAPQATAPEA